MTEKQNSLHQFHPLVQQWFKERFGKPTDIQEKSWPKIAKGEHVLITAPTGSGKTLTAFLWAIDQLITGRYPSGHTSILYISPLKALNNDIQRNLIKPLEELRSIFDRAKEPFPPAKVLTRSGDTPQADRRKMQRYPPEILITTPESFNLMLSSTGGRSILGNVSTVILDEIHSVINSKRGTYLITAVDRLTALSGEFQRIALSATVRPLKTVAEFIGGFSVKGDPFDPIYQPRTVSIFQAADKKKYELSVQFPEEVAARYDQIRLRKQSVWEPIVRDIKKNIEKNRSTLVFVNSRRLCEKITFLINKDELHPVAYTHHGSLSRELRSDVERKLKAGDLKAIVATNSLELGIDIGTLDEVILIQTPPSISAGIQRIGRAGHDVGRTSNGLLFPTHSHDFLESAVMAAGIIEQDIESVSPVICPLDVLALIIISMTGTETWDMARLYMHLKATYPYHDLTRDQFDLVMNMLAGRYADSRIRELKPRVSIDRLDNTVKARKGALLALYMSGGVIPDRGYFHLRHYETHARIGELDEEFVWEARVGQTFTLGTQNWKIERITHNDVFVLPGNPRATAPPFWIAEPSNRNFHFSDKIGRFLERCNGYPVDSDLLPVLEKEYLMAPVAARELVKFLDKQKKETGCGLPHRHHILVEHVASGAAGVPGNQIIIHTFWGGCVNRPFAMAFEAAWEKRFSQQLDVFADNNCLYFMLPNDISDLELLSMVSSANLETLIRKRLEGSGFFGARFRECAGRALLISRKKINERMPLWISRLKSKKLLDSVVQYEDFPILLETWRTCLKDTFDLASLSQVLTELELGKISWTSIHRSHPSPMAMGGTWRQINQYMYREDEGVPARKSRLRDDLIHELVSTPGLRPTVSRKIVDRFEWKRKRQSKGYSPDRPQELLDWVKERILIPVSEWQELMRAATRDHRIAAETLVGPISKKLIKITPEHAEEELIAALEQAPGIIRALYGSRENLTLESMTHPEHSHNHLLLSEKKESAVAEEGLAEARERIIGEWLSFYGPVTQNFIQKKLGLKADLLKFALKDLLDSHGIISGRLVTDSASDEICDQENFEILLRLSRKAAVPDFKPIEIGFLPLFLATVQGTLEPEGSIDRLYNCLEQMICYPAAAEFWEAEIFPARMDPYDTSWMDTAMQQGHLLWVGTPNRKILFCFEPDLDLIREDTRNSASHNAGSNNESLNCSNEKKGVRANTAEGIEALFPDKKGKYSFSSLLEFSRENPSSLMERLWNGVWQGWVGNDTFITLRKGIENRFKMPDGIVKNAKTYSARSRTQRRSPGGRSGFSRWKAALPFAGNWHVLYFPESDDDLIEDEEKKKDRVRLLLERYGILFKELLHKELPSFQWRNIFRSLRIMELSGEILSGYFFVGIPGPQFISHRGFHILLHHLKESHVFWINAMDPNSLCGLPLDSIKGVLPRRLAGTHLVYRGNKVVLISQRNGRKLTFNVAADDPQLQEYLIVLRHLMTRRFLPLRQIAVETINEENASRSPFVDFLRISFDVLLDYKHVVLYRKA